MNIRELGYRVFQQLQFMIYKFSASKDHRIAEWKYTNSPILKIPQLFAIENKVLVIFEHQIDYERKIDWHFDLLSKKKFPMTYCFDIDIRTDKYGSAKYVWEVNRMLFLPRIAINFTINQSQSDIDMFISHISNWKEENPYLIGVNWYSNIEVNIRLINWAICWELLNVPKLIETNLKFKDFVESVWMPLIYQHCLYSANFPSLYSSANNHLIAEHAGLFVSNCIWTFPESEKWLAKSKRGLEEEILKQHTTDGVNKEQAAEYIQFITDFFLISSIFGKNSMKGFSSEYSERLSQIFEYIFNLLDKNGNFPQYGDEDDGKLTILNNNQHNSNFDSILVSAAIITNNPKFKLHRLKIDNKNLILFGEQGIKTFNSLPYNNENNSSFLRNSGHFIFKKIEDNNEIYLHFNAAPLGYLSIAAHGHSDALSVICNIDGYPFLVDSGTYTYHTEKTWRNYFISSLAHNTLTINQENQAINGGPLLWTKHYEVKILKAIIQNDFEEVKVCHNGYVGRFQIEHIRNIRFDKIKDIFEITDTLLNSNNATQEVSVVSPWHFHPSCTVEKMNEGEWVISRPETQRRMYISIDKKLKIEKVNGSLEPIMGWYSKSFYKKEPCTTIKTEGNFMVIDSIEFKSNIRII